MRVSTILSFLGVRSTLIATVGLFGSSTILTADAEPDEIAPAESPSWLEETEGERALEWVHARNERSLKALMQQKRYPGYYAAALAILQDKNRIPAATIFDGWLHDGWVYNLWQDDAHQRGLFRRTRLDSYVTRTPEWETLLDVDALSKAEGKNWKFQLPECLPPDGSRCLIHMSDGGSAAGVMREFDVESRSFVENGFILPQGVAIVAWKDDDTVFVATDFGPGTTRRPAGYPLVVKEWSRGQPLSAAREIYRDRPEAAIVSPQVLSDEEGRRLLVVNEYDMQRRTTYWVLDEKGRPARASLPSQAELLAIYRGELVLLLHADWTVGDHAWKSGSLLSMPVAQLTQSSPTIRLMLAPGPREMIYIASGTRGGVLAISYTNARARLLRFTLEGGRWSGKGVALPGNGTISTAMSDPTGGTTFVTYQDFLQPTTLYAVDVAANRATVSKSLPAQFDSSRYVTEQLEATSRDGTRVPYFIVRSRDFKANGQAPTLMHGYGASGVPDYPRYSGVLGRLWLDQGGVYVHAIIRGGGEFGSAWHVTRTQRQHTYEDFIAIAEDLIRRKITSPAHLGLRGLSSGGLLMGVMITQRPDLFNAAVLEVPVLDLFRYDLLQDNPASIAREFGSPDIPEERAFLERTSPYQNLRKQEQFPVPFLITSTRDDNVRPAQARRFAAKMEALGLPYLYYETSEGGHSAAVTPNDHARLEALAFTYLAQRLMDGPALPLEPQR